MPLMEWKPPGAATSEQQQTKKDQANGFEPLADTNFRALALQGLTAPGCTAALQLAGHMVALKLPTAVLEACTAQPITLGPTAADRQIACAVCVPASELSKLGTVAVTAAAVSDSASSYQPTPSLQPSLSLQQASSAAILPVAASSRLPLQLAADPSLEGAAAVQLPQDAMAVALLQASAVQTSSQNAGIVALSDSSPTLAVAAFGQSSATIPATIPAPSPQPLETVKAVVSAGGSFQRSSRQWRYVGGEIKPATLRRTGAIEDLLLQLEQGSSFHITRECSIKYQLPGSPEVFVDLINDQDVINMWEEISEVGSNCTTFKLYVYVQFPSCPAACKPGSKPAASPTAGSPAPVAPARLPRFTDSAREVGGMVRQAVKSPAPALHRIPSTDSMTCDFPTDSLVSDNPRISLEDLESQIEIFAPEQLSIRRFLGAGSYGEVYLARWYSNEVAVKCLNPSLFVADGGLGHVSHDTVEEMLKEAAIMGQLRHPNIVWVYGVVLSQPDNIQHLKANLSPGQGIDAVSLAADAANATGAVPGIIRPPALVTEYMPGGSLHAAIKRKAEYLQRHVVKVKLALDAAKGMEYLHSKRIVHFDLKSGNLLITFRDKAPCCKVTDFGLSKRKQQTYLSGVSSMRGTLPWTAPEIISTPHAVTEKVDVYSFGVVMWELWTGREPYEGVNFHALIHLLSQQPDTRPPLPGSADWDGDLLSEPAQGYQDLLTSCWQDNFQLRPRFSDVVHKLEEMFTKLRLAKRRTATI